MVTEALHEPVHLVILATHHPARVLCSNTLKTYNSDEFHSGLALCANLTRRVEQEVNAYTRINNQSIITHHPFNTKTEISRVLHFQNITWLNCSQISRRQQNVNLDTESVYMKFTSSLIMWSAWVVKELRKTCKRLAPEEGRSRAHKGATHRGCSLARLPPPLYYRLHSDMLPSEIKPFDFALLSERASSVVTSLSQLCNSWNYLHKTFSVRPSRLFSKKQPLWHFLPW